MLQWVKTRKKQKKNIQLVPKTQKILLDAALLSTQHYKVGIKDEAEQSRERSSTLSYPSVK